MIITTTEYIDYLSSLYSQNIHSLDIYSVVRITIEKVSSEAFSFGIDLVYQPANHGIEEKSTTIKNMLEIIFFLAVGL